MQKRKTALSPFEQDSGDAKRCGTQENWNLVFENPLLVELIFRRCRTPNTFNALARLNWLTRTLSAKETRLCDEAKTAFAVKRNVSECSHLYTEFYYQLPNGWKHGLEYKSCEWRFELTLYECSWVDNMKHGVEKYYNENDGMLVREYPRINGKLHGVEKQYHPWSGKLWIETSWNNGNRHGAEKVYYDNGLLEAEILHENHKRHGTEMRYHENGQLALKRTWVNGVKHGVEERHHENGIFSRRFVRINGVKDGVEREWDRDGRLVVRRPWRNGKRHGIAKYWKSYWIRYPYEKIEWINGEEIASRYGNEE